MVATSVPIIPNTAEPAVEIKILCSVKCIEKYPDKTSTKKAGMAFNVSATAVIAKELI